MDEQGKDTIIKQHNLLNILENIKDGFWLLSWQENSIYINQSQAEILGKPKEEILGKNIWQTLPKLINTEINRQFQQVITQKKPLDFEYLDRERQRWYEYRVNPTAEGISIFTIDITDRKQKEEAQQETIEQFQSFMNYSPASAWIASQEGKLLYLSPTYFKMFQLPEKDAVGKNISEIYTPEFAQQFLDNNQRVFATKQVIETIESAPRLDGNRGEFLVYKFPIFSKSGEILLGGVAIDITERRQTEKALRENEQHLKIALETAKLGAWQVDLETGILSCSPQCKANFGLPPDAEFSHETLFSALHPEDRKQVQKAIARAIDEKIDYEVEERCFWPDGSLHWLIARGGLVYDREGIPIRMVGVTLDISERKLIEESLKAANQRISNILESITDGFVAFDNQWRYTYVNQEAARLLGRSPQDLLGKRWQDIFPQVADSNTQIYQDLQRAINEKITVKFENFSLVVNRWLEISAFPFSEGLAVYFRDITQQKRTEEALKESRNLFHSFMDYSPIAAFIKDEAGRFVFVNTWIKNRFGKKQIDLIGKTDFDIHSLETAQQFRENDLQVLNSGETIQFLETIDHEDGKHDYVSVKFPLLDSSKKQLLAGVAIDVTERIRAEEALSLSNERFLLAARAVNGIVYDWDVISGNVYRSEGLYTLIGVHPDDVPASRNWWSQRIHPDDLERIEPLMIPIIEGGGDRYEFEYRVRHEEDRWIEVWDRGYLLRDQNGQLLRVVGSTSDITERKRAEEALRESAERLNLALAAAKMGDWSWDAKTDMVTFSERGAEIFAIPPGSYMTWTQIRDLLHPEDRERANLAVQKSIRDKSDYDIEYRLILPDRRERWVAAKGRAHYAASGEVLGMFGVVQDISERKQAEQERENLLQREQAVNELLQLFIEHTPAAVAMLDRQMRYIITSRRWLQEYAPDYTNINGLSHYEVVPDGPDSWRAIHQRCLAGATQTCQEDYFVRADGSPTWLQWEILPWYNSKNEIGGIIIFAENITPRKQAEEALRQTETRLNVALKNSPITVFNQDRDLRYTWIYNPALNYQVDEIIGKRDDELFHQSDITLLTQIKRRVLATGIAAREEVKIDMPDRDYYFDLTVEPVYDIENKIIGITCASIDISERKQMELAISKSETILNAFLTSSPMAVAFLDQELRYIYANEALAAVNGVPLDEHIGRSVWEVLPDWAPQIQTVVDQVLRSKQPLLNQEVSGETNPPGVYRYGLVNYHPVYLPDGQVLGVGLTSMDITHLKRTEQALRESEERYRSLVTASSQIVWRANGQGKFVEVEGWEEFTGQPVEELLGGSKEAIHPDDLERVTQAWWKAVKTKSSYEVEHRIRKYDGTFEYFAIRGIPVFNASGEIYAWVGMTTNINERKQAEMAREKLLEWERQTREEAERANRIKDEFLAVLSHELRSPLNPILGWTQMLRTYKLDEKSTQQALETIERNARLQTQLIEDLLDISRILRGKMALTIAPVNLVSVIESALETVRLAAEAKNISIETVSNTCTAEVLGDSTRLGQIVWNLLSNAVKFTPKGGQIQVSLEILDTYAQIQVKDTGKGISSEFLPHVFEYFRQEDSKTTRKYGGLGLGLAIVRHLAELHGGTVGVASPGEGLGATFTVNLPLTVTPPSATIQDDASSPDTYDLSQLQILVVDDEADMRELLVRILELYGAKVRVSASAAEALTIIEQIKPDVLISDIGMPDVDGYMLMQQIKQLPPERRGLIRAIALTAYAGELNKQKAFKAGFQKHLSKPVDPSDLIRTIVSLVGKGITSKS